MGVIKQPLVENFKGSYPLSQAHCQHMKLGPSKQERPLEDKISLLIYTYIKIKIWFKLCLDKKF